MYSTTKISMNRKTGPIPVITAPSSTCPPSCALMGNGCYAEGGPLAIHWRKISSNPDDNFDQVIEFVNALPTGKLWRYGQAGDLPGSGLLIDRKQLFALAEASIGKPALVYTHKPVSGVQYTAKSGIGFDRFQVIARRNLETIRAVHAIGFHVNISCDTPEIAAAIHALDLPAVCVAPANYSGVIERDGVTFTECPVSAGKVETCIDCKALCSRPRDAVIVFPAHGASKRKVQNNLDSQRDLVFIDNVSDGCVE